MYFKELELTVFHTNSLGSSFYYVVINTNVPLEVNQNSRLNIFRPSCLIKNVSSHNILMCNFCFEIFSFQRFGFTYSGTLI